MKIKLCGIKTAEDIKVVTETGADAAGFLVGQIHASRDFILPSTAARLAIMLPPYICPVIVTHFFEAESIMELIVKTGITTIQLHGECPSSEVKKLRSQMPSNGKIIFSTYVKNGKCLPAMDDYYKFIDAVLLDCFNQEPGALIGDPREGEDQRRYDFDFGAEFVKKCPKPVMLAGGLGPENLEEAITKVRPYGIDANNHLKHEETEQRCPLKCKDFVRKAREISLSLGI